MSQLSVPNQHRGTAFFGVSAVGYRLPSNLHRNRHGALYFRLTVPEDLRNVIGQREIYRSLHTCGVREAAHAAQTLRIAFRAIFSDLRIRMSDDETNASSAPALPFKDKHAQEKLRLQIRNSDLEKEVWDGINSTAQGQKATRTRVGHCV